MDFISYLYCHSWKDITFDSKWPLIFAVGGLNLWKGHEKASRKGHKELPGWQCRVVFCGRVFWFNGFFFLFVRTCSGTLSACEEGRHWKLAVDKFDQMRSRWFLGRCRSVTFHFSWVTLQETNLSRGPPSEPTVTWENRAPKDWQVAFVPWWCI